MAVELRKHVVLGLLAAALGACSIANRVPVDTLAGKPKALHEPAFQLRKVIRVVDGDTMVISPNEKVRLIGVDTPESVHPKKALECFGKDAAQFTRAVVEGKTVRLMFDEINQRTQHKDKYGRTLAYAYLDDGQMLNRELIRQGYGRAYTRFPFHHLAEFRVLEREARQRAIGLWAACPAQAAAEQNR